MLARADAPDSARSLAARCAVSWSGGKDSMLALDRAVRQGLDVRWLFNIYDGATGRVRFHGVRRELIARQADALSVGLIELPARPADFEAVFLDGLGRLLRAGAEAIIFGNIHLADVRAWYEERTRAAGLDHIEPLWGEAPQALVAEVMARGYRALITSVDLARGQRDWAGRELDAALASAIAAWPGVDPAGEHGEFHSFVFDGPLFRSPVTVRTGELHEAGGHVLVDLLAAAS